MAILTTKEITGALLGAALDASLATAAGGGDTYLWSPDTVLIVLTGATASQTVTIDRYQTTVGTPQGVATLADLVITTAASDVAIIDTTDESFRNATGYVAVTYSGVTNMEVVPVKLSSLGR